MFGWQEWAFIIIVVLVIFGGAKKLPGLARSVGKSFREFKKAVKDVKDDVSVDTDDEISDIDKPTDNVSDIDKPTDNVSDNDKSEKND